MNYLVSKSSQPSLTGHPLPRDPVDLHARGVSFVERQWVRETLPDEVVTEFAELVPNESQELISKRKHEFDSGRFLAANLLAQLDAPTKVGVADDRSPIWPSGLVGSISHSTKIVWAAVARRGDIASIGIDTEPVVDFQTRNQLRDEIATPIEWATVESLGLNPSITFTLAFSAKEAFYKCIFPLSRLFFGFHDVEIKAVDSSIIRICMRASNPSLDSSTNEAWQCPVRIPQSLDVQFLIHQGNVFTAAWISNQTKFHHELP